MGVDSVGEEVATYTNIPIRKFPADWQQYGKIAGYIRNKQMGEYADALLLVWDGKSRGSAMMRSIMLALGKPVIETLWEPTL
jgi:hypothetical protein